MKDEWQVGDLAVWMHKPSGGYGYTLPIDVRLLEVYTNRVIVEAPLARGGTKRVRVLKSSLRRPSLSPQAAASGDAGREGSE